jgi:hypothetical protein
LHILSFDIFFKKSLKKWIFYLIELQKRILYLYKLLLWLFETPMPFYRVDEYRICPRGKRGSIVTIPNTVLRDLGVKPGETLSVYRGSIGGLPVAVMANIDAPELAAEARE